MELVLDSKAVLGEGPSWDAASERLFWVDTEGHTVHIYNPKTAEDWVIPVGQYVGLAVPRASGGVVVALQHGFCHLDLETETLSLLREVEGGVASNRFNDGKCDALGRLWAGTMDLKQTRPTGALYCLDTTLEVRRVIDNVTISNGLGWSPDNRYMYFIDTRTRRVFGFDFDLDNGTVDNRRVIVGIDDGYPDGMCVDGEGMIWVAHWGGSKITKWNPYTGEKLDELLVPVTNVTCCTFGGPSLRDLYITTARAGLVEEMLSIQPTAGGLFRHEMSVRGLPTYAFNG